MSVAVGYDACRYFEWMGGTATVRPADSHSVDVFSVLIISVAYSMYSARVP